MNKLHILSYLIFLVLLVFISGCKNNGIKLTRPNILFILADDLGWQDCSVPFGPDTTIFNIRYNTPSLERLAADGIKFTQAYSCAVCSPTRVSLMTGMNEISHGVTQWTYLSSDIPLSDIEHPTLSHSNWNWNGLQPTREIENSFCTMTLPELLKAEGYRTMIFGKGHFGAAGTPGADPKNFGFDIRIGGRDAGGCGSYYGTEDFGAKKHPDGPWRAWDLDKYFWQDIHLTEALTLEAVQEIKKAVEDEVPFFCYLAHFAPHTPIDPDERFAPKYRTSGLDEIESAYASLIEGIDKSTGDLLDLLDSLNISDNTIVVFTSDNGGVSHMYRSMSPPHEHNLPLSSGKGSHHEGGIRVPLIVRWPGVTTPGNTNETPVMIYDWYPTLLEAAEVEHSKEIDGVSLKPILQNKYPETISRPLVWHFPNFWGPLNGPPVEGPGMGPSSTIILDEWKLIYYHSDMNFELFNIKSDLSEKDNLAVKYPQKVKELADKLNIYLEVRNAPMPRRKDNGELVPYPGKVAKTHH